MDNHISPIELNAQVYEKVFRSKRLYSLRSGSDILMDHLTAEELPRFFDMIKTQYPNVLWAFSNNIPDYSRDLSISESLINRISRMGSEVVITNKGQDNCQWFVIIDGDAVEGRTLSEAICFAVIEFHKRRENFSI